jgi:hypothetical protein
MGCAALLYLCAGAVKATGVPVLLHGADPKDPAVQIIAQGIHAAASQGDPQFLSSSSLTAYHALQSEPRASQATRLFVERHALFAIESASVATRTVQLLAFAKRIEDDPKAIPSRLSLAHQALEDNWRLQLNSRFSHPDAIAPFLTGLAEDPSHNLWIGSEEDGLWRLDPPKNKWKQFTAKDSLQDTSIYAVACDKSGRVWAGTLNHGVWVYNGREGETIDGQNGLLGERVFAIATCPTDGDVWIATEAGITRYSQGHDSWTHYTTLDGLPSNQASALAFDRYGDLYVGTACDGIAIATAQSDYRHWRVVQGPASEAALPPVTSGKGLPSGLINCLLVSHAGEVYAGTAAGLAMSSDNAKTWRYVRGADWADKRQGESPISKPASLPFSPGPTIAEDWVTSLAEDSSGRILIGHRAAGLEVYDSRSGGRPGPDNDWVTSACPPCVSALLPIGDLVYIASYGNGLSAALRVQTRDSKSGSQTPKRTDEPRPSYPALPSPAGPPMLARMNDMLSVLGKVAPAADNAKPLVIALNDDWQTQGEWLGRYGRYWACLCAMQDPGDYVWGAGPQKIDYKGTLGANHNPGDLLRSWTEWASTDLPSALEMPPILIKAEVQAGRTTWSKDRRGSEWDDHGEMYPLTLDGPHVYCSVKVPAGLFYLSLYEFNKDGHIGANCYRDWRISLREHKSSNLLDITDFDKEPELAHARIYGFCGGVWKRFLVRGPISLTIQIDRNHSYNTNLEAITLDLVDEDPPPYFHTALQWLAMGVKQNRERAQLVAAWQAAYKGTTTVPFVTATTQAEAADRIMDQLDHIRLINPAWWAANSPRFYETLLPWYERAAKGSISSKAVRTARAHLGTCCYQACQFSEWEECQGALGLIPARQIELALRHTDLSKIAGGNGKPWQPVVVHSQAN